MLRWMHPLSSSRRFWHVVLRTFEWFVQKLTRLGSENARFAGREIDVISNEPEPLFGMTASFLQTIQQSDKFLDDVEPFL